jgi:hypothetical protein
VRGSAQNTHGNRRYETGLRRQSQEWTTGAGKKPLGGPEYLRLAVNVQEVTTSVRI